MNPCIQVGMDFFSRAPHVFTAERVLRASPDRIFTSFENAADWSRWVPVIRRVTWSCEMPYRVGSTRTVHMLGGLVADEVFIAWERGREMAFCFSGFSDTTLASFAEHYVVEVLDGGHCRIRWKMAMEMRGISRWIVAFFSPLGGMALGFLLRRFATLVEARS